MHQIINIIVYADNQIDARGRAEHILNNSLTGDGKSFDYGTFFDDDSSTCSGKARWGEKPSVVKADSIEGKKLINNGMKNTKDEMKSALKEIRELINSFTDEELVEGEIIDAKKKVIIELKNEGDEARGKLGMFQHYCNCFGEYEGSCIFVYDNDGSGIRTNSHLNDALNKWNDGQQVWVIPVDVHS